MKHNQHKEYIESNDNINTPEKLFHDNEIKTNKIAWTFLLTIICVSMVCIIPLCANLTKSSSVWVWSGWVVMVCCFIELLLLALIRKTGFESGKAKYLLFIGLILISGITYFLYPLTTMLIFCGPILISIKYYNPKLSIWVSVASFFMFIITVAANYILDTVSVTIHNMHIDQGMTMWSDLSYLLTYYVSYKIIDFILEGIVAYHIAGAGKKLVLKHSDIITKAALMSAELNTASRIQDSTLEAPDFSSPDNNFTLSASIKTAKDVGGDFYDYFMINDHIMVAVVADVSDKGLPAAMYAVEAQSFIRFAFHEIFKKNTNGEIEYINLEEAMNAVNHHLALYNMDNMFVTMWLGCFDTRTGIGKYVNAGHERPYIIHADNSIEKIVNEPQLFMGAFENTKLKAQLLRLEKGDRIVLYTDGATDALNEKGESYGAARFGSLLETAIQNDGADKPVLLKESVFNKLEEYIGNAKQYDDITIMVLSYNGNCDVLKDKIELQTGIECAATVMEFVNNKLTKYDCYQDARRTLDIIIDEVCSNITENAYGDETGPVSVELRMGTNFISIRFEDSGVEFNPIEAPSPDITNRLQIGGLGIHFIKNLADDVRYKYEDGKNILTVYKIWNM